MNSLPSNWVRVTHHSPAHIAERYPYAGYGSNLWLDQVSRRCPEAEIVGAGHIPNCQLRFAYYATIKEHVGTATPVAVYRFNARDVDSMDRFEGLRRNYERYLVTVTMADGSQVRCFTYIKINDRLEPPNAGYYKRIEDGYKDWNFDLDILRAARSHAQRHWRKTPTNDHAGGRYTDYGNWEPIGLNGYAMLHRGRKPRRRNENERVGKSLVTGRCRTCGEVHKELLCPSLNLVAQYVRDNWKGRGQPPLPLADPTRTSIYNGTNQNIFEGNDGQLWRKDDKGIWRRIEGE